jgi:hypothetical protein
MLQSASSNEMQGNAKGKIWRRYLLVPVGYLYDPERARWKKKKMVWGPQIISQSDRSIRSSIRSLQNDLSESSRWRRDSLLYVSSRHVIASTAS